MKHNVLGKTNISVSELSFGSLILGRIQANMTPAEAASAVSKALELGINFFDTAQSYGTQEHLRVGLGAAVDDVVVATKTHARNRNDAQKAFEESLRELGREHIDIYHLHLVDGAEDLEERRDVMDFFLELKQRKRIRAIGASVHKVEAARAVAEEPAIDVLFPVLNSEGLGIIDGSADQMLEACRMARARGKGIYVMKPLAGGHLRRRPGDAFHYLRDTRLVDSICVGMKTAVEVEMNVRLFEGRAVPEGILERIDGAKRSLRIYPTCEGCGACIEACDQGALRLDESKADPSIGKKGQSVVDPEKCILCGYCAAACPRFVIRVV